MEQTTSRVLPARRRSCFFPVIYRESASPYALCPGLIFLTARSCQSEFGCATDEKLFTVAAAFNRLRDPRDPFLLCASNPLGGRALWVAPSVASASKMHEWVERSEKRARLAPDIRQNSGLTKLQFGTRRPLA
jgi:hypothetical protein